jgi:choline dehydrogenase
VLANRLSESGKHNVLLLEAGPSDWNPLIHIPVGYAQTLKDPSVNWLYETEEDPGSNGRKHVWPRGKVLGGSSSINGLLYVRGQPADYDNWAQLGATGWSSADVLPYFRRSEGNERLKDGPHGGDGPLNVSDPTTRHPVSDAVVQAGIEAGLPFNDDVNGEVQDGISYFQLTVKKGMRWSAAQAYLKPAMRRLNLQVETEAQVASIQFAAESGGRRATGVTYRQDGRLVTVKARREVILCGGAVNSPQLLEVNGIGDPAVLKAAGIPVRHALPGVGTNLQDHYVVSVQFRLKPGTVSVNEQSRGWRLALEVAKYAATRKGLLTLSAAHVQAYWRSRPGLAGPDVQYHILPATVDIPRFVEKQLWELERVPGLTIAPCQLRPESRGTIHVTGPDPFAEPAIRPNYLADPIDQQTITEGLKFACTLAAQPALRPWVEHRLTPAEGPLSDAEWLAYARELGSTIYHPVGTCRMGQAGDPGAVVDPAGRVHGVQGLRVIDASVMPRLVSGNTNAPTIMIAEKMSDSVLADARAALVA